jgi:hypothetical protein
MKYINRIDVKPITEEEQDMIVKNMERLGISNKSEYIRMLIHLDFAAHLVKALKAVK